jgi:hypothetical protein
MRLAQACAVGDNARTHSNIDKKQQGESNA